MKRFYKKVHFFYNDLGIHEVIICFTISLCITKNGKSFESYISVQYLLKCSAFGSVLNRVTNMSFLVSLLKLGD